MTLVSSTIRRVLGAAPRPVLCTTSALLANALVTPGPDSRHRNLSRANQSHGLEKDDSPTRQGTAVVLLLGYGGSAILSHHGANEMAHSGRPVPGAFGHFVEGGPGPCFGGSAFAHNAHGVS